MTYRGPTKFCLHGIESSAMSMCEKCREDREHGLPNMVTCPHFPKGRPVGRCKGCYLYQDIARGEK